MVNEILEELKKSQGFLATHSEILRLISICGLRRFLEEKSRAYVTLRAPTHTVALEGARTAGYTECLLDILYFKERYFQDQKATKPEMTFGMLDVLEKQGDLMPEEIDAIRTGTDPKYPSPKFDPTKQPANGGSNT